LPVVAVAVAVVVRQQHKKALQLVVVAEVVVGQVLEAVALEVLEPTNQVLRVLRELAVQVVPGVLAVYPEVVSVLEAAVMVELTRQQAHLDK
jgi:hypothetical protein